MFFRVLLKQKLWFDKEILEYFENIESFIAELEKYWNLLPDWDRIDKNYDINPNSREDLIDIFYKELALEWYNIEIDKHFMYSKNSTTTMQVEKYFLDKF